MNLKKITDQHTDPITAPVKEANVLISDPEQVGIIPTNEGITLWHNLDKPNQELIDSITSIFESHDFLEVGEPKSHGTFIDIFFELQ